MSETSLILVKRKDIEEALHMVEDALELLEEQDPHTTSEDLKVLLEHAYSILREILRKGAVRK
jgi:NifU-like protein involved in Fe-S cluster formation